MASPPLGHDKTIVTKNSSYLFPRIALPFGEPDLLLVFGGSYLRLHGFPPWQLRLTEM